MNILQCLESIVDVRGTSSKLLGCQEQHLYNIVCMEFEYVSKTIVFDQNPQACTSIFFAI